AKGRAMESTRDRGRSDTIWSTASVVIALCALLFAAVAVVAPLGDGAASDRAGATDVVAAGAETVEVELGDLWVKPARIEVPAGTDLTLVVTNTGAMPHDLKLGGEVGTPMLAPGETAEAELGV